MLDYAVVYNITETCRTMCDVSVAVFEYLCISNSKTQHKRLVITLKVVRMLLTEMLYSMNYGKHGAESN